MTTCLPNISAQIYREEDCPMMNSFEKEFDIERGNYTYEDDNTTLSFQAENSTE